MVRTRRLGADRHVGRLGVVPDLRGQGPGRWLPGTAEAAAEAGCRRVVLHTGVRSLRNIRLCQNQGYQPVPLAGDHGTVCLTKDITPSEPD